MAYLLGKYWHIWISMFRMSVASSLSFITGVPLAKRHHFSWGTCCNVRHPSIPCAQHFVLAVSTLDSQRLRIWQTVKHVLHLNIHISYTDPRVTAVAQWLRCCATNRKVAGSILAGVSAFFIDIKSFRSHYGPGVDSGSNRNEYQGCFLGVKAAGA